MEAKAHPLLIKNQHREQVTRGVDFGYTNNLRDMTQRVPPPGKRKHPYRATTPDWILLVKRSLDDMGKDQAWLAREVKAKRSSISIILSGKVRSSSLVDPISKVLSIPLPGFGSLKEQELAEAIKVVLEGDAREFLLLAEAVLRSRDRVLEKLKK